MYDPLKDIDFINKRIKEQEDEIKKHDPCTVRGIMLYESASKQLEYFTQAKRLIKFRKEWENMIAAPLKVMEAKNHYQGLIRIANNPALDMKQGNFNFVSKNSGEWKPEVLDLEQLGRDLIQSFDVKKLDLPDLSKAIEVIPGTYFRKDKKGTNKTKPKKRRK